MVQKFKRLHMQDVQGSEMYDDMADSYQDDEITNGYSREFTYEPNHNKNEGDCPNIDSPKFSKEFSQGRTIHINNKMNEADDDYNVGSENEPDFHNEPNLTLDRKVSSSSSTNQGDYEVIGEQTPRKTIVKKSNFLEEDKENKNGERPHRATTYKIPTYNKTDKSFSEISNCKKENLSAKVYLGKVNKDSFFSFSYPSYQVEIHPIGWKVTRKEADFLFLREYLRTKYPQHFVPPLILTRDKLTEHALMKKEKYFTRFLINVLRNSDLRGSYFLQEFLSIEDQTAFEKLVEQRRLERLPEKLADYTTVYGKANTKSRTQTWQFCYNISNFAKKYEELNKNISDTSKKLVQQFNGVTKTMQELSSYFDQTGELYMDHDENMHEMNKSISVLLSSWSDSFDSQGKILKNWFPRFFKYNKNEYRSMTEMLDHRNFSKDKFVKMQTELENLKTKLYNDRDFTQWELSNEDKKRIDELDQDEYLAKSRMLPEPTKKLNEQKLLLNYLNNTMESEIKRVLRYNYKDLKSHFLRIADQQCQILTNTQIVWSEFIAHYVDEKEVSSDEEYISCFDSVKKMKTSDAINRPSQT